MSIIFGSVTINRNPSVDSKWHNERLNQYTEETADGGRVTYDNGPTITKGTIIIRNVAKTEADNLATYLTGTAIYGKNSMTIDPPANTDLGAGAGTAITAYYDGGNTLEGVFQMITATLYNINFPYKY